MKKVPAKRKAATRQTDPGHPSSALDLSSTSQLADGGWFFALPQMRMLLMRQVTQKFITSVASSSLLHDQSTWPQSKSVTAPLETSSRQVKLAPQPGGQSEPRPWNGAISPTQRCGLPHLPENHPRRHSRINQNLKLKKITIEGRQEDQTRQKVNTFIYDEKKQSIALFP